MPRGCFATDGARAHHLRSRPPRPRVYCPDGEATEVDLAQSTAGGARVSEDANVNYANERGAVIASATSTPSPESMIGASARSELLFAGGHGRGQGPPAI